VLLSGEKRHTLRVNRDLDGKDKDRPALVFQIDADEADKRFTNAHKFHGCSGKSSFEVQCVTLRGI